MGQGETAKVYSIDSHRVIKFVKLNKDGLKDMKIAQFLENENWNNVVKVYQTGIIKIPIRFKNDLPLELEWSKTKNKKIGYIIQERVEQSYFIEKHWIGFNKKLENDNALKQKILELVSKYKVMVDKSVSPVIFGGLGGILVGLAVKGNNHQQAFLKSLKPFLLNEEYQLLKDVLSVITSLVRKGIDWEDIHEKQFGYGKNGQLKAFDIDDSIIGDDLSFNPKNVISESYTPKNYNVLEKRSNPELNIQDRHDILDFLSKKSYSDKWFVSFRKKLTTTFVNPFTEYITPAGYYTYPLKLYKDRLQDDNLLKTNLYDFFKTLSTIDFTSNIDLELTNISFKKVKVYSKQLEEFDYMNTLYSYLKDQKIFEKVKNEYINKLQNLQSDSVSLKPYNLDNFLNYYAKFGSELNVKADKNNITLNFSFFNEKERFTTKNYSIKLNVDGNITDKRALDSLVFIKVMDLPEINHNFKSNDKPIKLTMDELKSIVITNYKKFLKKVFSVAFNYNDVFYLKTVNNFNTRALRHIFPFIPSTNIIELVQVYDSSNILNNLENYNNLSSYIIKHIEKRLTTSNVEKLQSFGNELNSLIKKQSVLEAKSLIKSFIEQNQITLPDRIEDYNDVLQKQETINVEFLYSILTVLKFFEVHIKTNSSYKKSKLSRSFNNMFRKLGIHGFIDLNSKNAYIAMEEEVQAVFFTSKIIEDRKMIKVKK
jgi:hypothetical protein